MVFDSTNIYKKYRNGGCIFMQFLQSFARKIKKLFKNLSFTNIKKGLYSLRHDGFKTTLFRYRQIDYKSAVELGQAVDLYKLWREANEPGKKELEKQRNVKFEASPLISIIIPVYNTPEKFLMDLLDSMHAQTYQNFEICFADGDSENAEEIESIIKNHPVAQRSKYVKLPENLKIVGNSNAALKFATGDFFALLDHDDILPPWSLFEVAKAINENPGADFLYSDEDKIDEKGENRYNPHFKPQFSPDYLRACNYITHFAVFKKELMEEIGGFREGYDGSQDHDLVLRASEKAKVIVHISKILYHWRVHDNSVAGAQGVGAKPYAIDAGVRAVQSHIDRIGLKGTVSNLEGQTTYVVKYEVVGNPLVSIIIPNKDHIDDLKICLDSIFEKSTYENFEIIIIENNSEDENTFKYYEKITKTDKINVVKYEESGFNFSKINNFGVGKSNGEFLIFLNNDTKVISENWIEEMVGLAQREDVGVVGTQLIYPDDTIQHAGVVIGIGGVAGHIHHAWPRNVDGNYGRLITVSNFSAVTAACMMVKRSDFDKINGFDEELVVAFNDIDFCLRVLELKRYNAYTPGAKLYHYESKSRGSDAFGEKNKRFHGECIIFERKWKDFLKKGDPYYSPNLSLISSGFEIKAGDFAQEPLRLWRKEKGKK